jgi:hypothetical protein
MFSDNMVYSHQKLHYLGLGKSTEEKITPSWNHQKNIKLKPTNQTKMGELKFQLKKEDLTL